jgi:type II secretory pathway component PulF
MALGHAGRFFAQLALFLHQRVPMRDALDLNAADTAASGWSAAIRRIRDRIDQGASLSTALAELPDPFPRDLVPIVGELESGGLVAEDLEALSAWPDAGTVGLQESLARMFGHASILIRQGKPAAEALGLAIRPGDPEPLKDAMRELSTSDVLRQSISGAMSRFPDVFSPAVRRIVHQMELNGSADRAFRELAVALSRGWFLPGGSDGTPAPRGAL